MIAENGGCEDINECTATSTSFLGPFLRRSQLYATLHLPFDVLDLVASLPGADLGLESDVANVTPDVPSSGAGDTVKCELGMFCDNTPGSFGCKECDRSCTLGLSLGLYPWAWAWAWAWA